jgi:hypothetical protein
MADMISELRRHRYRELAIRSRELARQAISPAARRELLALARSLIGWPMIIMASASIVAVPNRRSEVTSLKLDQGLVWNDCCWR